jgi:hypothetical protein
MCYGSVGSLGSRSKRASFLRKLDLPPKFVSALSTKHSVLLQPQKPHVVAVPTSLPYTDPPTSLCVQPLNTTVAVALHPQMSQFVQPHLTVGGDPSRHPQSATVTVPIATFHTTQISQSQTFAISTTPGLHNTGTLSIPQGIFNNT